MSDEQRTHAADTVAQFTKDQFENQVVQFLPESMRDDGGAQWDDRQSRGWEWLSALASVPVSRGSNEPTQEGQDV